MDRVELGDPQHPRRMGFDRRMEDGVQAGHASTRGPCTMDVVTSRMMIRTTMASHDEMALRYGGVQ